MAQFSSGRASQLTFSWTLVLVGPCQAITQLFYGTFPIMLVRKLCCVLSPKAYAVLYNQHRNFLTTKTKMILLFLIPLGSGRLQDFAGLIFIFVWEISSFILFNSLEVHDVVGRMLEMLSTKPLMVWLGSWAWVGLWCPSPRSLTRGSSSTGVYILLATLHGWCIFYFGLLEV